MKKVIYILLSVIVFSCFGCSNKQSEHKNDDNVGITEVKEDTTITEATIVEEKEEVRKETTESEEIQVQTEDEKLKDTKEDDSKNSSTDNSKKEDSKKDEGEPSSQVVEDKPTEKPAEKPIEEVAPAKDEEPVFVSYDPQSVVSLATAKTKGYGKISIPEDLDRMLANGEITKEVYDQCYPYDGAGYYSVFVETNLAEASTTSGSKLETVDGIASYISGMLGTSPPTYFYIEYTGTSTVGGKEFYEFRCYRA